MANKIYVGDTGTQIILDCGQDITSATSISIEARDPKGVLNIWAATFSGTNAIKYTTSSNTLYTSGNWKLQAHIVMPTGNWRGETATLAVSPVFG